jgi:hypothetical protein
MNIQLFKRKEFGGPGGNAGTRGQRSAEARTPIFRRICRYVGANSSALLFVIPEVIEQYLRL